MSLERGEALKRGGVAIATWIALVLVASCTNNPYPDEDDAQKVYYTRFATPPKTLDPQVSYASSDQDVLANVYETLLEYHYLKRPYTLIPGLAATVPEPNPQSDGSVRYRFEVRRGVRYADDPCFALSEPGQTRELVAADVEFALKRIADPEVTSPVIETFGKIRGLRAFRERLVALREKDPAFASLRIDEQYRRAGAIEGVEVESEGALEITLAEPYPQIIYWFAMPFTSPVPWEAVAYYDGKRHDGVQRPPFSEVAVGTGPFVLTRYDKRSRIVLERNPNWYGALHPEWKAPATLYPSEGASGDEERGVLVAAGRPLPFIDRIEMRYEKESIPAFTKFIQGYYDLSGIITESFSQVVSEDRLSPGMSERGMSLEKSVQPTVRYLGFNMLDPVVGHEAGRRGRKLRQAMSLVIDTEEFKRVFTNGRGISAHSPIPPGIYGHDPAYENPYRTPDVERARELLKEAGYPGGRDPKTGAPLKLTFDTGDTSAAGRLRYLFFTNAWRKIGIDVEIEATSYNQFRQKVRNGSYQIFLWGWIADYPDPENFLFLLYSPMGQTKSGGPNTANFSNERYDALFAKMKDMENGEERLAVIREMQSIVERERPWIEFYFEESYALVHSWMKNYKPMGLSVPVRKYLDVDPVDRSARREAWNTPIRWPAYGVGVALVLLAIPGVVTFFRERQ